MMANAPPETVLWGTMQTTVIDGQVYYCSPDKKRHDKVEYDRKALAHLLHLHLLIQIMKEMLSAKKKAQRE